MQDQETTPTLIQTKLSRPPLPVDMVRRPRLTTWLEQRRSRPLTLVSAPAGYGKSTLISCWLEAVDCPTAWLSLDENDNELVGFLHYFLAAIESIFPNVMPEAQALLMTTPQPPITATANTLINELNQIEHPYILVLDDYHLIEAQTIQDLLIEILAHPPRNLHLVLGTRSDPFLPLVTLRANSQVTEIRAQDLRFNQAETLRLFENMIGLPVNPAAISEMDSQAEGWVTGLRLAALAMQNRIGRLSFPGKISIQNRYVTEYLVSEILAKQAENLSDCMLKVSLPKRFCADLCEALCFQGSEQPTGNRTAPSASNGAQFLEWLQASNLFIIPLDDQREWFRYHHLFRDFLQQELTRRFSPDEIANLHATAGRWYAQKGWIEEALYHLLTANDISAAIQLIAQQRYRMMNATQWLRLERWLKLFPGDVIETSAELWMLKTWLANYHSQFTELPALLEHLVSTVTDDPNEELSNRLAGEISTLRSLIAFHSGNPAESISQARLALEQLPPELWIVRILARNYLGGGLLLTGDISGAYQAHYDAFEEEQVQNKRFKATLLAAVCDIHWFTADLQGLKQAAKQCVALCQETGCQQILGFGTYHLGRVRYQQNDLAMAEELFTSVVAKPYQNYGECYVNSACGQALTYQAQGREVEAREVVERAIAFFLETGNITQLPVVLALQAELALMQGHLPVASQWAKKLDPPPLMPMYGFLAPHLTLVKVWLAQNTPANQDNAAKLLKHLGEYLEDSHSTRFLIETLALQALLDQALGNQTAALAALEQALRLAQPGGFIRLFVDLGPQMAVLLSQLKMDRNLGGYIDQIHAAFLNTRLSLSMEELPEPLTQREFQVLELLGNRLTNKEIAAQLSISPGTVRQHAHNIYQKLAVSDRRQAAAKAVELGILTTSLTS